MILITYVGIPGQRRGQSDENLTVSQVEGKAHLTEREHVIIHHYYEAFPELCDPGPICLDKFPGDSVYSNNEYPLSKTSKLNVMAEYHTMSSRSNSLLPDEQTAVGGGLSGEEVEERVGQDQ